MPSTVTTTGEQFLNTVATGHTPLSGGLLADQILFANIDGLDHTQTPPITEIVPATLVHTAQVTRASNLNADTAVFTTVLESHVGDFSFNWLGLYNSEYDVLIQVSYEPVQQKIATDGPTVGNVLAKGLALQVLGGQSVLNMQTATESWQFDFTGRQKAAEEIQRNAMRAVYGSGAYVTTAGNVTKGASVYQVAPGQTIIDGLRIDLQATDTAIASDNAPENYPFYVYAEVWQQVDSNAVTNHSAIVTSQTPLTDITDPGGNIRTRVLLATLDDENTITDARAYVIDALTLARPATLTTAGQVSLSSSTTSTSETEAATPKAVKTAKDAADAAQSTANNALSNANQKLNPTSRTVIFESQTESDSINGVNLQLLPEGFPGDGFYVVDGHMIYISENDDFEVTTFVQANASEVRLEKLEYQSFSGYRILKKSLDIKDSETTAIAQPVRIFKIEKINT